MDSCRIISLNVRSGLNDKMKLAKFIQYMKDNTWDIALLQETSKIKDKTRGKIEIELEGKIFQDESTPGKNAQGIAQIYKNRLLGDIKNIKYYTNHRISKIEIEINTKMFSIINVYLNSNQKKRRKDLIDLSEIVRKNKNEMIIGGDFNSILDKKERFARVENKNIETGLLEIINRYKLVDVKTYLGNNTPTYIGQNNAAVLDRFIVNRIETIAGYLVEMCPLSDHQMIILDLFQSKTDKKTARGVWKLNTSLLKNIKTREKLKIFWEEWQLMKHNFNSYKEWWDKGKDKIKKILIQIGIREAKDRKNEEKTLKEEFKEEIKKGNYCSGRLHEIRKKLNDIMQYKIEGAKIRSRELQWPSHEKGSKDFFAMENKNYKRGVIDSILKDKTEILEKERIKEEIYEYYKNLYTSEKLRSQDMDQFVGILSRFNIPKETKRGINKFISIKEAKRALEKMKNNRSPGSDGLPKEFYLELWDTIGEDLVETLNNNILSGSMTNTQKEAIIKLLYKKGERRLLKNWRPVSLLNVDYKIMTAVVAQRLIPVLQTNISREQGCAIKGRYIYENLKLIKDIIEKHEDNMNAWEGGKIVTIDQEKAFDRVEHEYIFKILEKIQLGEILTKLIKLAYNNINTRIQTIAGLTDKIKVSRSVRQGCPLSMALYIIISEPLIRKINTNKKLRGIEIDKTNTIKITAYADDTTIFTRNEEEHKIYQQIFKEYERASGARINEEKTKEIQIGRYRRGNKIKNQEPVEILGILFSHNKAENQRNNWNKTIETIKNRLNRWKSRKMTMLGRVTTLNSFGVSQLLYLNRIFPLDIDSEKRIEKAFNNYIFDTRPLHYSNANMVRSYDEGGFNLPDIRTKCESQNLQWFFHYLGNPEAGYWKIIFKEQNDEIINHLENKTNRKNYRLNSAQKDIISKIENIKKNSKENTWGEITFRETYNWIKKGRGKKFKIEETLKNVKWEEIWRGWKTRNISNKYKLFEHLLISDHYNTKKRYNKSKNCPGCDYAFVQSRDHTFYNCLGSKSLQKYIRDEHNINITHDKLFYGKSPADEYTIIASYIATIMKSHERYIGKWGKAGQREKIEYFEKVLGKIGK